VDVISKCAGTSWMLENRAPHIVAGDYTPLSSVDIWPKDLGIVLDIARGANFSAPLTAAALQQFLAASGSGLGREDDAAHGVALGPGGSAIVAGQTQSANFTTTNDSFRPAYAAGYRGASDAFVARIDPGSGPSAPCIALNGLLNGASFLPGPVAPGQIVTFFGAGLGPEVPVLFDLNGGDRIATELAGTRVLFNGTPGPVIAIPVATTARTNTYSQPSATLKNPLGRCTVQPATTISPTTPAAASGVSRPTASIRPATISVMVASQAWNRPGRIPMESNQRPVPGIRPPRGFPRESPRLLPWPPSSRP